MNEQSLREAILEAIAKHPKTPWQHDWVRQIATAVMPTSVYAMIQLSTRKFAVVKWNDGSKSVYGNQPCWTMHPRFMGEPGTYSDVSKRLWELQIEEARIRGWKSIKELEEEVKRVIESEKAQEVDVILEAVEFLKGKVRETGGFVHHNGYAIFLSESGDLIEVPPSKSGCYVNGQPGRLTVEFQNQAFEVWSKKS